MSNGDNVSGWAGWAAFAGVMMILLGALQAILGFFTLFNDDFLIFTPDKLFFVDLTTWAWVHFFLALLVLFAGFATLSGQVWGRTLGVIMAMLSVVANVAFIPAYPIWSILVVTVDLLVIYALIVHGHELRSN